MWAAAANTRPPLATTHRAIRRAMTETIIAKILSGIPLGRCIHTHPGMRLTVISSCATRPAHLETGGAVMKKSLDELKAELEKATNAVPYEAQQSLLEQFCASSPSERVACLPGYPRYRSRHRSPMGRATGPGLFSNHRQALQP